MKFLDWWQRRGYITLILVALLLVIVTAVGCGDPPLTEGTVVNREFTPAHWESGYRTESYTDCGYHSTYNYQTNEYEYRYTCEPATRQVYESHHRWVEDRYRLRLHGCETNDDGESHCRESWLTVPADEYERFQVGVHYPNPG